MIITIFVSHVIITNLIVLQQSYYSLVNSLHVLKTVFLWSKNNLWSRSLFQFIHNTFLTVVDIILSIS